MIACKLLSILSLTFHKWLLLTTDQGVYFLTKTCFQQKWGKSIKGKETTEKRKRTMIVSTLKYFVILDFIGSK